MTLNLNPPESYASEAAGDPARTAAAPSRRFPFTAIHNAGAAAASSSVAVVTDEHGRKLVEQGAGSVVVSKFGDDILLGVECNGRHSVRLSADTALLVAEHIKKLVSRKPVAPQSAAAAAAKAVDQARTSEATDAE